MEIKGFDPREVEQLAWAVRNMQQAATVKTNEGELEFAAVVNVGLSAIDFLINRAARLAADRDDLSGRVQELESVAAHTVANGGTD